MRRLLREPLLHFLVLGALLFVLYGWLNRGMPDAPNAIVLSRDKLGAMEARFAKVWQRPPTPEERQGLIDGWVRDEVLYREGLALGFDRDDPVVRRRVGQKMAFLVESGAQAPPTTTELQAWLDAHPGNYRIEAAYTLRQIYFDPGQRGETLEADLEAARRALAGGGTVAGDSTLLPAGLEAASASEVVRTFGSEFAGALAALPVGAWSGPVRSGFGLHLVEISARDDGRQAALEEVRAAVERDLLHARTQEAGEAFYEKLRSNYTVRIEDDPAPAAAPQ